MKRAFIVVLAILASIIQLAAQGSSALTLESAVQIALKQNISVIQSRNSIDQAQSVGMTAFGNYLPSLDLSGGFSRQQNWKNDPSGFTVINGVPVPTGGASYQGYNNYSGGLNARVTLFNGFATSNGVKRADAGTETAEQNFSRTQQSVAYQTHFLYLNVVRTYQLMKVSEENLKRSQRQLERIEESNKVGAVALADVYRQRVQAGTDELSLIQAQSNYEKSKADVLAYLGVALDREYTFDVASIPSDIDTTEFAALNQQYSDFSGLARSAVEKRPDHLAAVASLNGATAGVSVAQAAYYPVVSASGNYGYGASEFSSLPNNRNLSLTLGVSLPIFNGFQTQSSIQQAQVTQRNAEENLAQNERQLRVDIRKALLDLEASEKAIKVTQSSVVSAEMDQKIAQEKYNLGSGTLLDLLIANANLTQALGNKVNAVNDYLLARKGVELAVGTITK